MGSFQKKTEVLKATRRETFTEVDTGKRKLKFGSTGAMIINDPGEANAVEERYGYNRKGGTGEVTTMAVDDYPVERGHKYAFGAHPPMPWAKYDDLGRRLPDEQEEAEHERKDGDDLDRS
jgi:hypothetical protein